MLVWQQTTLHRSPLFLYTPGSWLEVWVAFRIWVQRVTHRLLCTPVALGPGLRREAFQKTKPHINEKLEESHSVSLSDEFEPSGPERQWHKRGWPGDTIVGPPAPQGAPLLAFQKWLGGWLARALSVCQMTSPPATFCSV